MMLMLVEELELHNIHVLSANTDGIVIKLYKRDIDVYNRIKDDWEQTTKLKFDTDYYHCLVSRDINNYLSQFRVIKNGVHKLKLESKGALNPMMYSLDLTKGYSMPIVAQAIENYFLKNKPVMDTLQEATNILDFCLTQNVGKQFHVEETKIENGQVTHVVCQRYVRFYVSNRGYIIEKVHNDNGSRSRMAAGSVVTVINSLDDKDISLRDINFKFYYQEAMKVINSIYIYIMIFKTINNFSSSFPIICNNKYFNIIILISHKTNNSTYNFTIINRWNTINSSNTFIFFRTPFIN
jgi:hypothetical protein